VAAGHEIIEPSDAERARWVEALQPMMDAYVEDVQSQGVDNAAEIYEAMKAKIAEYESANQ
jgi:TRAP-type transport system periplasmic protein